MITTSNNSNNLFQVGTYQIAVMAKALNKPFYVVAESFKFVRLYPLKQDDIRNVEKVGKRIFKAQPPSKGQDQRVLCSEVPFF